MTLIDGVVEPETGGNRFVGGVLEGVPAADRDWYFIGSDVEAVEHFLRASVRFKVDERIGVAVSRQELLYMQSIRRMGRPDEHHVADAACDQLGAAENRCAPEEIAQLAVRLDERQQFVPSDLDDLARFRGLDAEHRTA